MFNNGQPMFTKRLAAFPVKRSNLRGARQVWCPRYGAKHTSKTQFLPAHTKDRFSSHGQINALFLVSTALPSGRKQ